MLQRRHDSRHASDVLPGGSLLDKSSGQMARRRDRLLDGSHLSQRSLRSEGSRTETVLQPTRHHGGRSIHLLSREQPHLRRDLFQRLDLFGCSQSSAWTPVQGSGPGQPLPLYVRELFYTAAISGRGPAIRRSCPALYLRTCLLYTSPSPRDRQKSRMPSSA